MNILLYTNFNERSNSIESTIIYLNQFHSVKFLTTVELGPIHAYLTENGIACFTSMQKGKENKHIQEIKFLKNIIKTHQIDMVHAHLQLPCLYASIACYFSNTKLLTVRHNSDLLYLQGSKKEIFIEKIINRLSPKIVAISDAVKKTLEIREKVNPKKIVRINNGYDFSRIEELCNAEHYLQLQKTFENQFIILMPCRFIKTKRHELAVELMDRLKTNNANIHLIFIGEGPEKNQISSLIQQKKLEKYISVLNFTTNIGDYYKLSDAVIQTSSSEASNNVLKEALHFDKAVFACKEVGDFDTYLTEALLLDKTNPIVDLENKIRKLHENSSYFKEDIQKTKQKMLELFSMEHVGKRYDEIHLEIFK